MNWIEISGTRYVCGSIVLLSSDFLPIFGFVTDIIVLDVENYYLVCEVLETVCFNSNYHSYEVCHDSSPFNFENSLTYVIIMYFQCIPKTLLTLFH